MRFPVMVGELSRFAGRVIAEAFRPPYEFRETVRQLFELGCRSVPLIAASGFAVGSRAVYAYASVAGAVWRRGAHPGRARDGAGT